MALPATYRAYVIEKYGDPARHIKLRTNVPHAPLGSHQVRIRVHSAALNPLDHKIVETGHYFLATDPSRDKPLTLGFDVAGTVVEVGSVATTDLHVGDHVFGYGTFTSFGTFAEYAVLDATSVIRKPKSLTFNQAAGFPLVAVTSYQVLIKKCLLQSGARVLILGGASATGALGIQIAKAYGASFVATTASQRNVAYVQSFGADQIIDYTKQNWYDVLQADSIDIIYDCGVEADAWKKHAHKVLKKKTGQFITILPPKPTLSFIFKFVWFRMNPWRGDVLPEYEASISESPIGATFQWIMGEMNAQDLTVLSELVEQGKLSTPIDSVFAFDQLQDAMKKLQDGKAQGKIILEMVPSPQAGL